MNVRILLVEDNPDHAELVRMALEQLSTGLSVEWVDDGDRAHARLPIWLAEGEGQPTGLMLLDLNLPGRGGVELLGTLRGLEGPQSRLPVVVLTSSSRAEDRDAALQAGADAYLVKCFRSDALQHDLEAAMVALCGKLP